MKYNLKKDKKQILPILETKKQLNEIIEMGNIKLNIIKKTIRDMEGQNINLEVNIYE